MAGGISVAELVVRLRLDASQFATGAAAASRQLKTVAAEMSRATAAAGQGRVAAEKAALAQSTAVQAAALKEQEARQKVHDTMVNTAHAAALAENMARERAAMVQLAALQSAAFTEDAARRRAHDTMVNSAHAAALAQNAARERSSAAAINSAHGAALAEDAARRRAHDAMVNSAHAAALAQQRAMDRQAAQGAGAGAGAGAGGIGGLLGMGTAMYRAGQRLAPLAISLALIGKAATKASVQFEASMAKITGLTNTSRQQTQVWGKELLDLAPKLGRAPQELADSLYFVASAGLKTSDVMGVLKQSATAAAAGLGGTQEIAKLVSATINAYGLSAANAADITDKLTATVKLGTGEVGQITDAIGRVLPFAANMGVTFGEVGAAIAALTQKGLSADEAVTGLKGILTDLTNTGAKGDKALQGVGSSAAQLQRIIRSQGLLAGLTELNRLFGQNADRLNDVIDNSRATNAVLSLTGDIGGKTKEIFQGVTGAFGDTARALAVMQQTPGFRLSQSAAELKVAMIALGDAIVPVIAAMVGPLASGLRTAAEGFRSMPAPIRAMVTGMGGSVIAAASLLLVFGGLFRALKLLHAGIGENIIYGRAFLIVLREWQGASLATTIAMRGLGFALTGLGYAAVAAGAMYALNLGIKAIEGSSKASASNVLKMVQAIDVLDKAGTAGGQMTATFGKDWEKGLDNALKVAKKTKEKAWKELGAPLAGAAAGSAIFPGVGTVVGFGGGLLSSIKDLGKNQDIQAARKKLDELSQTLAMFVSSGKGDEAARVFTRIKERAKDLGIGVKDLKNLFKDYFDAQQAQKNQGILTPDAPRTVEDATKRLTEAQRARKQAQDELNAATLKGTQIATQYVASQEKVAGLIKQGNIDLLSRPSVKNKDGSVSTVRSITITDEKQNAILIPTVSDAGKILSNQDAIKQFLQSGRHLGVFKDEASANAYAKMLHEEQAKEYGAAKTAAGAKGILAAAKERGVLAAAKTKVAKATADETAAQKQYNAAVAAGAALGVAAQDREAQAAAADKVADAADRLSAAQTNLREATDATKKAHEGYSKALAAATAERLVKIADAEDKLADAQRSHETSIRRLTKAEEDLNKVLNPSAEEWQKANDDVARSYNDLERAQRRVVDAGQEIVDLTAHIAETQQKLDEAIAGTSGELSDFAKGLQSALAGAINPLDEFQGATEKIKLTQFSKELTDVPLSLNTFTDRLRQQVADLRQWAHDLNVISGRGFGDVAQNLAKYGPAAAGVVAAAANASDDELKKLAGLFGEAGALAGDEFARGLANDIGAESVSAEYIKKLREDLAASQKTLTDKQNEYKDALLAVHSAESAVVEAEKARAELFDRLAGAGPAVAQAQQDYADAVWDEAHARQDMVAAEEALNQLKGSDPSMDPSVVAAAEAWATAKEHGAAAATAAKTALEEFKRQLELAQNPASALETTLGWTRDRLDDLNDRLQLGSDLRSNLGGFIDDLNTALTQMGTVAATPIAYPAPISGEGNPRNPGPYPIPSLRALGGPVVSRRPYWVGERGPELFVPGAAGDIINAAKSARMMHAPAVSTMPAQTISANESGRLSGMGTTPSDSRGGGTTIIQHFALTTYGTDRQYVDDLVEKIRRSTRTSSTPL